ncbi:MAG: glycosyltransferase family 4 protein, partial [Pseudomonadota bacterium]
MLEAAPPDLKPLRVTFLGLRGCPDIQGGVERHVEQLAPRLARHGCDVEILVRKPYAATTTPSDWNGVRLTPISCPTNKSLEAIVHTFFGILYTAFRTRPDVLHIHAVGPMLLVPLARLMRLKVVVTHHGYDYQRDKWGGFAKAMLKAGERFGLRFANKRIAVSQSIAKKMYKEYRTPITAIPNGVDVPDRPIDQSQLAQFGLERHRYVLAVGRLVPEKRHGDLIKAFSDAAPPGWKLAIVGAADHPDAYSRSIEDQAAAHPNVVLTGFQKGDTLQALYKNAGLFTLPSSHEGLPIALLEALSFGLPCIASDIDANLEVGLARQDYHPVGDINALAIHIREKAGHGLDQISRDARRDHVERNFSW